MTVPGLVSVLELVSILGLFSSRAGVSGVDTVYVGGRLLALM